MVFEVCGSDLRQECLISIVWPGATLPSYRSELDHNFSPSQVHSCLLRSLSFRPSDIRRQSDTQDRVQRA